MYIAFEASNKEKRQDELDLCYRYGLAGERVPQSILDARLRHHKNVGALEQTLVIFMDETRRRMLHGRLTERLKNERKWLDHFTACINNHKRGRELKRNSTTGFSFAHIACEMTIEDEKKKGKPAKDNPGQDRSNDKKMLVKAAAEEPAVSPAQKRRFFMMKREKREEQRNREREDA